MTWPLLIAVFVALVFIVAALAEWLDPIWTREEPPE